MSIRKLLVYSFLFSGKPVSTEDLNEVAELSGVMSYGDDYLEPNLRANCERIRPEAEEVGLLISELSRELSTNIFKLTINYSNSHIVQGERKEISCESPLAWRRLDAAWMQLCL